MGIILMIVLGAIAGWIASAITSSSSGVLMDIVLGIVGAIVGGLVMNLLGKPGVTGFDIYSLVVSVVGAIIVISIGRMLAPRRYA